MGCVLHVHAQWVTPSPVPGGAIGQSLKGSVLSNIRKLFTHQALERSKENAQWVTLLTLTYCAPWDRAGGNPLGMDM